MDIQQLKYFVAIAQNKSFTKAANELFISQAALSKQISNLEKKLGVSLFERKKKNIYLSPAGEVLLNEAIDIIKKFENAIELTKKYNSRYNNVLKIGYLGPAEAEFLPDTISSFKEKYNETEIYLKQDNASALMVALKNKELDLFFSGGGDENLPPNIIYKPIHRESFVVVLNKNHPLSEKATIDFADLSPFNFITLNKKFASEAYDMLFKIFNVHLFEPKTIYEVESLDQLIVMVKSGIGCTILPKRVLQFYNCTQLDWKVITNSPIEYIRTAVWDKHNENPYITLFLNEISTVS